MAELLNQGSPIQTQDTYVTQLTLGPAAGVKGITLSVLSVASCLVQCWRYVDQRAGDFELDPLERTIAGQSVGNVFRNCAGIQIRSKVAGAPATVLGELAFERDIEVEAGSVTSATIGPTGAIA